jgi:hypothetical protein
MAAGTSQNLKGEALRFVGEMDRDLFSDRSEPPVVDRGTAQAAWEVSRMRKAAPERLNSAMTDCNHRSYATAAARHRGDVALERVSREVIHWEETAAAAGQMEPLGRVGLRSPRHPEYFFFLILSFLGLLGLI